MIIALLGMGILASFGSFSLKRATENGISPRAFLSNPWFYLGGILYTSSALLNLYLLRILPYSVVVPLGSLTYIWTLLISRKFLGEQIGMQKVIGILLILLGVTLLSVHS
jgi:uncharacterized membrane protein